MLVIAGTSITLKIACPKSAAISKGQNSKLKVDQEY
jgi:hypothetical protein